MVTQLPLRIFCGYAHEDEAYFHKFNTALAVLRRQEAISIWHYGDLVPGVQWEHEIEQELNTADIILLLISPAFMASDYCWSKEMRWAITRHTTGETYVIPIILKPTDWKTTPLSALQALPKGIKPITTWSNCDEAFADVIDGLRKVIQDAQQEDKYPVKEYVLGLRPSVFESEGKVTAQDQAKRRAEQWLEAVSSKIGGTLRETTQHKDQKEWIFTDHQQLCSITMKWDYRGMDVFQRYFRSADITLTSQHPALLDRMIEEGQLPYQYLQWTLDHDWDITELVKWIREQTGKTPTSASLEGTIQHVEYTFHKLGTLFLGQDHPEEHTVRVTLTASRPSSPGWICFIHDYPDFQGFYHAHKLFPCARLCSCSAENSHISKFGNSLMLHAHHKRC